ncbi:MAG: MoaD/ThiS family protein [Desulfobacteraceae bacterium]|nr:MoaD/ThiS family protein [Desulfobacteraceae bacterium]
MPPTIEIKLFASLAKHMPMNADHYPIREGITIKELLEQIQIKPGDAKLIFVNSVKANPETQLSGGETIGIFPPVGGG